jgi:hypothetical protein
VQGRTQPGGERGKDAGLAAERAGSTARSPAGVGRLGQAAEPTGAPRASLPRPLAEGARTYHASRQRLLSLVL